MDNIWQLGLALGLAIDAGLALALALSGQGLHLANLGQYVSVAVPVAVICWAGLAPLVAAFQGAVSMFVRWDIWHNRNKAPSVVAAAPLVFPPADDAEAHAWAAALSRFFRAGDAAGGFSVRKLAGVIGEPAWARLTDFYTSDAGNRVLRVGPGDQGTVWNWGWELDYVLQRINAHGLPHPTGPVPEVEIYVVDTARQATKRRSTAAKAVVEGTARAAD